MAVLSGAFALLWLLLSIPDVTGLASGWPEQTAYMQRRLAEAEARGENLSIAWTPVPLSSIPRQLRRAVLVSEDAAFYDHQGFDWFEVRAALRRAWEERSAPRGASTISQQLARNLYLSPDRRLFRKLREALIAWRIEELLPKGRIFELYLNVIELGPGLFGMEAAARRYFSRGVSEVSRNQAAQLAATIPSPLRHNPTTNTRNFRWRSDLIYERAFGEPRP